MKTFTSILAIALLCVNSGYGFQGFVPRSVGTRLLARSSSISMAVPTPQPSPPERYSSNDWWLALSKTSRSRMLPRVFSHLSFNIAWTSVLTALYSFKIVEFPETTPLPWTLLASGLSLLLVFRTNSAYDRFWEARKLLGALVNTSRNVALVGCRTCEKVWTEEEKLRYVSLAGLFPHVMMLHLSYRDSTDRVKNQPLVSPQDKDIILASGHRPMKILDLMSECFWPITSRPELLSLTTGILMDILGACERIVRCPVPQVYSRHTSRFLSLYTLTMPLIILPTAGVATIPVMTLFCWALFVLEEIGHTIENPFDKEWTNELMNSDNLATAIQGNIEEVAYGAQVPSRAKVLGYEEPAYVWPKPAVVTAPPAAEKQEVVGAGTR